MIKWIVDTWKGEVNPGALVWTVCSKNTSDWDSSEYGDWDGTKNYHWTRKYTYEDRAPVLFALMGVVWLLLWLPHFLLVLTRGTFYTMWLPRTHPFIVKLQHNKDVLRAKYGFVDTCYY